MKQLCLALLFIPFISIGQGIRFDHTSSWSQLLQKAKQENKYIFIDCFTTWCGPCLSMAKEVFPQIEVGDFFNANFISVKVQFDSTAKDDEYVRSWYPDMRTLRDKYKINGFPTFLFFTPEGEIAHIDKRGARRAEEFIAVGKDALDPNKQYYHLVEKFNKGERDSAFLEKLAETALNVDEPFSVKVGNALINQLQDPWTKEAAELIKTYTRSSKHRGFNLMLSDTARFGAVTAPGMAQEILSHIIYVEQVKPHLSTSKDPSWKQWEKKMISKYPKMGAQAIAKGKYYYYKDNINWTKYTEAFDNYINRYGGKDNFMIMNNAAWEVFQKAPVNEKKAMNLALKWSRYAIAAQDSGAVYLDTYANLLYKLGRKTEAIKLEQKAIDTAPANEVKDYVMMLEKMKRNEPTW